MTALVIETSDKKAIKLIADMAKQLGAKVISETSKTPNKVTKTSMKNTAADIGLTKTTSHEDLMKKLNA